MPPKTHVRAARATGLKRALLGAAVAAGLPGVPSADAFTRSAYLGLDATSELASTRAEEIPTNLWAFPAGMARDGAAGPHSVKWVSKYGSLIASGYDAGTADGMNARGLVASVLYLAETDYGKPGGRPAISLSLWAQDVLDNFATVAEAVEALRGEPFIVAPPVLPGGTPAQLHLAISDETGDAAILGYSDGRLVIHHGRQFEVTTNSPRFYDQMALTVFWQARGGLVFLPGRGQHAAAQMGKGFGRISAVAEAATEGPGAGRQLLADDKDRGYSADPAIRPHAFWVPLAESTWRRAPRPRSSRWSATRRSPAMSPPPSSPASRSPSCPRRRTDRLPIVPRPRGGKKVHAFPPLHCLRRPCPSAVPCARPGAGARP